MSADRETLTVYEDQVQAYAERVANDAVPGLEAFLDMLPAGGRLLDLGCGPGHVARVMIEAGFGVDATDASPAMVAAARDAGVPARVATFDEIAGEDVYDGVWANFSLLHAPRAAFPFHLMAIHRALKPGGLLHIGMKLGDGEGRDRLGRFYTYYTEDDLVRHLTMTGFTPGATFRGSGIGLEGTRQPWIWVQAHG